MTILVQDSFDRADNATTLGSSWSNATLFGISNNQAYRLAEATTYDATYQTVNTQTYTTQVKVVNFNTNNTFTYLFCRYTNSSNFVGLRATNRTSYTIEKRIAGTFTTLATLSQVPVDGDILKIEQTSDGTIKAYINNVLGATVTDTALLGTSNNVGFGGRFINVVRFDDFVTDDGTGGTTPTNASIMGIIANASANTLNPSVSTDNTITSIIAGASADALPPTVSMASSVSTSINAIMTTGTADATNPSITVQQQLTITGIVADSLTNALSPILSIDSVLIGSLASSITEVLSPRIGPLSDVTINVSVSTVNADGNGVTVSTTIIIPSMIDLSFTAENTLSLSSEIENEVSLQAEAINELSLSFNI
jgi:hypothetical protein